MSVVVDSFPTGIKQPSQYPYTEWIDGRIHMITKGIDFTCEGKSMVLCAKAYYRRHGIPVTVKRKGNNVYIQRVAA